MGKTTEQEVLSVIKSVVDNLKKEEDSSAPETMLQKDQSFGQDIGLDAHGAFVLGQKIEERFGLYFVSAQTILNTTVGDLVAKVCKKRN